MKLSLTDICSLRQTLVLMWWMMKESKVQWKDVGMRTVICYVHILPLQPNTIMITSTQILSLYIRRSVISNEIKKNRESLGSL